MLLKCFFYNRWSKEGRKERRREHEEFNGIKTDIFSGPRVMIRYKFLMPQIKIHKHELLI